MNEVLSNTDDNDCHTLTLNADKVSASAVAEADCFLFFMISGSVRGSPEVPNEAAKVQYNDWYELSGITIPM